MEAKFDFLPQVQRHLRSELGIERAVTQDMVDAALKGLPAGRRFKAFRFMVLTQQQLDALQEADALGLCWTADFSDMSIDAVNIGDGPEDGHVYLFEATIEASSVDWPATVAQNIEIPWEREIRMMPGAEVSLIRIRRFDEAAHVPLHSVRPDLRGKVFAVAQIRTGLTP